KLIKRKKPIISWSSSGIFIQGNTVCHFNDYYYSKTVFDPNEQIFLSLVKTKIFDDLFSEYKLPIKFPYVQIIAAEKTQFITNFRYDFDNKIILNTKISKYVSIPKCFSKYSTFVVTENLEDNTIIWIEKE